MRGLMGLDMVRGKKDRWGERREEEEREEEEVSGDAITRLRRTGFEIRKK